MSQRETQFILASKQVTSLTRKGTKLSDAVQAAVKAYPEVGYRELFLASKTTSKPQ